jgi:hypothetical protein
MSRMNAAWSNEPPWAEAVPAIFKEPMTIAFGGAILAHAIFFLGLPVVAGSEKQPDVQPVATTVLTDQERAAVPADLAQSQFSTGGLMPGSNSGLTIPSIPSTPGGTVTTPGLGSGFGQLNEPAFSNGGYSTGSNSSDNSNFNTQLAEITRKQEADRKAKELIATIAAKDAADKKLRDQTPPTDGIKPQVAPTEADLRQQSQMPPGTPVEEKPKQSEGTPPAQAIDLQQKQAIALRHKKLIDENPSGYALVTDQAGPTIGDATTKPNIIGDWYTNPKAKTYDPAAGEIYARYQPQPQMKEVNTKTKTLEYPTKVNNKEVAPIPNYAQQVKEGSKIARYGTAIVGIAINAKGEFASDPKIIQSTGYQVLDEYAIEYARSQRFFVTGRGSLHFMIIPIDPPVSTPAQQATS